VHFSTDELDIAFENQAYDMRVGYVSEPVRTAQGYSIIKLTERVTKPIILESEFATAKENLTDYAYQKKDELVQREHMYNFIDNIEFDEEVFNSVWMAIQADFSGMLNKDSEFTSRLSKIDEALATSNGFEFSMDQFVEEYLVSDPPLLNTIQDKKSLEDFIKGTAYRAYMVQEARREGIDDQDLVQSSIEETWLNFLSMEATDYLRSSITNTPAELFNFYEANKTDFYQPAQINLQRLVLKTKEDAHRMLELLDEGASFKELVTTYTINNDDLFTNGVLGFASVKSYGFMATKLANLEKDEISEVLQYQNNEYHIYKMLDRVEAKPLSFNEAKDQVDQLLTRQKLNELRAETIENVKERHDAVVDLEKLKELTIQI
jgi:parvulin-like peptidyl-prolyl isomerase